MGRDARGVKLFYFKNVHLPIISMLSSIKYSLTVFHVHAIIADLGDHLSIIILTNFVELHSKMLHGEFPNQKTSVPFKIFERFCCM